MGPSSRKKCSGASGERHAVEDGVERRDTGPVVGLLDQAVLDRVGEGVDHLVDDVVGVDQTNDAGLLGGPEVLPATAEGVLTFGEEFVKMLDEGGVIAVGVVDAGMVVVAHRGGEDDLDPVASGSDGQAINECVVRLPIRTHEELPLGAAASDQVGTPRQDLARNRHPRFSARCWILLRQNHLGAEEEEGRGSVAAKSTSVR